jgi:hypothetical protein
MKLLSPNVQDEPRPWLARAVLLGARIVTAMVVGSGALLGRFILRLLNMAEKRDDIPAYLIDGVIHGTGNS